MFINFIKASHFDVISLIVTFSKFNAEVVSQEEVLHSQLSVMAPACNHSTPEAEACSSSNPTWAQPYRVIDRDFSEATESKVHD